jgi:hypothetical protein
MLLTELLGIAKALVRITAERSTLLDSATLRLREVAHRQHEVAHLHLAGAGERRGKLPPARYAQVSSRA